MVERRVCFFCGNEIEPGTGKMYVKVDGTVFHFCTSKCQKNLLELKRVPRRTRWSSKYEKKVTTSKKDTKKTGQKAAKKPKKMAGEGDEKPLKKPAAKKSPAKKGKKKE